MYECAYVSTCMCVYECWCMYGHVNFLPPISPDAAVLSPSHLLLGGFQSNNNLYIVRRCLQELTSHQYQCSIRHSRKLAHAHTHPGSGKNRHPKEMEESDTKMQVISLLLSLPFRPVDVWSCDVLWHSDVLPLWSRQGPENILLM